MAEKENKRRKRVKLHESSAENDIRYRGPLSYQHFQLFGWLCIVLSVVMALLKVAGQADESVAKDTGGIVNILEYITSMSLPFLLIANFSKILNNSEGYKKQLIRNGGIAAAIFAAAFLFFSRYVVSAAGKLAEDPENVLPLMTVLFRAYNSTGFIAINIFVDLFLCTLFMFFLNARPTRIFTGKAVIIFRLFALLPIAYEVASLVLKYQAAQGEIMLPFWIFPLLTVKPPITFVVFVILAMHVKTRELRFCRHGRTHEEYQAFLQTNRNSLHFSVYLTVLCVIAAIVDLVILTLMMSAAAPTAEAFNKAGSEELMTFARVGISIGFGESMSLIFIAPLVILYSYTRIPKNKMISMLIPAVGIVLIILVVIEGIYQMIGYLPIQKINIQETIQMLQQVPVQ